MVSRPTTRQRPLHLHRKVTSYHQATHNQQPTNSPTQLSVPRPPHHPMTLGASPSMHRPRLLATTRTARARHLPTNSALTNHRPDIQMYMYCYNPHPALESTHAVNCHMQKQSKHTNVHRTLVL